MIDKNELLREKERYNLPLFISKKELKKLKKDVPVQKIIGFQILQNVHLDLRYKVLIPRYETEELIIAAYPYLNSKSKVLDLGCGSGFIGLSIAKNKKCNVTLVDRNSQAIKQSKLNAKLNNLNVSVIKSNWFQKVNETYDLIISNPPYLKTLKNLSKSLKYEPKNALVGKNNGLLPYKIICSQAYNFLNNKGVLMFEIDDNIAKWFKAKFNNVLILRDINSKERIAILARNDLRDYKFEK
ncbi:peptide chain release factor N(5)-glutamine methyltransferase [Metamycoplasma equirhinis]|uniref:peptide chain release factor N(5)-glutamine methyltransferase n=1 Tax=Metamycoplasma equirhinis TaxID=92402 RepID=A0ABZ0PB07_9BACT|nr:peptide chain release factor N(5)-glutamine methyltransferase [Metamycoplasma equirhinis]TPD98190.1 peptide chain release factor N(5)-glutamine methyltransferase [Metamycoplasma equirhinis]WPB54218.1 peptide chain release factor N(5)-glutamine methyltransferase [Metamycoplasma equirhinis]